MEREVLTVLAVDSRHRDPAAYPEANEYVVSLNDELRNVTSVELVYALYPTFGTERYVNLFVRELEGGVAVASGAVEGVYGAFTQLPLLDPINEYSAARQFRSVATFRVPLARLSRLSVRFVDAVGVPYPIKEHFLRFEVRCLARGGVRESDYVQRLAAGPSAEVAEAQDCYRPTGSAADRLKMSVYNLVAEARRSPKGRRQSRPS